MTYPALLQTWSSVLLLLCALGSSAARAQTETAGSLEASRGHFNRGVEYVQDGDLKGALIEFKRAYAIAPNYRVLYNLGQVENELRNYTEAQAYFQRYLNDGGDDVPLARRREVEALVSKLSGRIATLTVEINVPGAEVFVDGMPVGRAPLAAPIRVSTGTRVLSAVATGRPRVTQVVEAAGGENLSVRLRLAPAQRADAAPRDAMSAQPGDSGSRGVHPAVWLGIGSGALAVGAGVMAYLTERDAAKYDDAVHRRTSMRELDDLDDRARTKALVTDVLLGAAVISTTITVIVATQSGGKPDSREHAKLGVGPGNVSVSGRF